MDKDQAQKRLEILEEFVDDMAHWAESILGAAQAYGVQSHRLKIEWDADEQDTIPDVEEGLTAEENAEIDRMPFFTAPATIEALKDELEGDGVPLAVSIYECTGHIPRVQCRYGVDRQLLEATVTVKVRPFRAESADDFRPHTIRNSTSDDRDKVIHALRDAAMYVRKAHNSTWST